MKHFQIKALAAAVLATAAIGQAGAVNVNADGMGQHLLYPYYTARGGNQTLLSVVNTTDQGKVVRVRFNEAKNTEDVLDFNLFLSPYDVWTGVVQQSPNSGKGARLVTNDTSCTSPNKSQWDAVSGVTNGYAVDFFNYNYNTSDNTGEQGYDRTLEGYVEMIEMASVPVSAVTTDLYPAIKHSATGVAPCTSSLIDAINYDAPTRGIAAPTGGMFGAATIFGAQGTSTTVSATALDGFGRTGRVDNPSAATPNFSNGGSCVASTTVNGSVYVVQTAASGAACTASAASQTQAAMIALMADTVSGEYAYIGTAGVPLGTDWVITHPGKRFLTSGTVAVAPFTNVWSKTAKTACEPIKYSSWDREESASTDPTIPNCFSGQNPEICAAKTNNLCFEANVISFGKPAATTEPSAALRSTNTLWLETQQALGANSATTGGSAPSNKDGGWMQLTFTGSQAKLGATVVGSFNLTTAAAGVPAAGAAVTFAGLPVIGFSATSAKVGTAANPLNNYSSSANLVYKRAIVQ